MSADPGRYQLFEKIGSGGAAAVHLGRMVGAFGFTRVVAIKRLHPAVARDREAVTMLLDEAKIVTRIRHPNVVSVLDVVAKDSELLIVMELVHGVSLSVLLQNAHENGERIPIPIVRAIMSDVLHGLAAAHDARDPHGAPLDVIHRDVSPQNIVIGVDGRARVLDFGIAKAVGRTHRTTTGIVRGKLGYMPPEQLCAEPLDRRVDVFAAGVVLWEALVNRRLFHGTEEEVVAKSLEPDITPPSVHVPEVSGALDGVVLGAVAGEPSRRFASALEMATALAASGPAAAPGEVGAYVEEQAADFLATLGTSLEQMDRTTPELEIARETESGIKTAHAVGVAEIVPAPQRSRVALAFAAALVGALALGIAVRFAAGSSPDGARGVASPPLPAASVASAPSTPSLPPSESASPGDVPDLRPVAVGIGIDAGKMHPSPKTTTKRAPCAIPFVIDNAGHKHFKPECL